MVAFFFCFSDTMRSPIEEQRGIEIPREYRFQQEGAIAFVAGYLSIKNPRELADNPSLNEVYDDLTRIIKIKYKGDRSLFLADNTTRPYPAHNALRSGMLLAHTELKEHSSTDTIDSRVE